MKLHPLAFGLTCGILWGLALMFATWWLLIIGAGGHTIIALKSFYLGYSFSYVGGFVGLVWGFVDGLICGYIFAALYNLIACKKE